MTIIALVEHRRSWLVHADPGGSITACGWPCSDERYWSLLTTGGSLYDVTCQRCIAVLRASGDLE